MSRLFVSVEALEDLGSRVRAAAGRVGEIVADADGVVDSLRGGFEGEAAEGFEAAVASWSGNATELQESLDELGTFLDTAARVVQEIDGRLADAMGGRRAGLDRIVADQAALSSLGSRVGNLAAVLSSYARHFETAGFHSHDIEDAVHDFRSDWSTARGTLVDALHDAHKLAATAAESFGATDARLAQAVSDAGP